MSDHRDAPYDEEKEERVKIDTPTVAADVRKTSETEEVLSACSGKIADEGAESVVAASSLCRAKREVSDTDSVISTEVLEQFWARIESAIQITGKHVPEEPSTFQKLLEIVFSRDPWWEREYVDRNIFIASCLVCIHHLFMVQMCARKSFPGSNTILPEVVDDVIEQIMDWCHDFFGEEAQAKTIYGGGSTTIGSDLVQSVHGLREELHQFALEYNRQKSMATEKTIGSADSKVGAFGANLNIVGSDDNGGAAPNPVDRVLFASSSSSSSSAVTGETNSVAPPITFRPLITNLMQATAAQVTNTMNASASVAAKTNFDRMMSQFAQGVQMANSAQEPEKEYIHTLRTRVVEKQVFVEVPQYVDREVERIVYVQYESANKSAQNAISVIRAEQGWNSVIALCVGVVIGITFGIIINVSI